MKQSLVRALSIGVAMSSCFAAMAGGAQGRPAPTCPREGPIVNPAAQSVAIRVERADMAGLSIIGLNLANKRTTIVRLCSGSRVDEEPPGVVPVRPGDLIYAYEVPDGSEMLATRVGVNTYTAYVRIRSSARRRLAFVVVNDFNLQPLHVQYPRYLGAVPNFGILLPTTTVSDSGRIVSPSSITGGRYAKIYGTKRPDSRTVKLRQVELLRRR